MATVDELLREGTGRLREAGFEKPAFDTIVASGPNAALPHAHPGVEQACYLLEGSAHVEVGGEAFELRPGEACFFPAEVPHVFTATSERVKVMVIYAPPYGEDPAKVTRHG